jgi:hypothetical protein
MRRWIVASASALAALALSVPTADAVELQVESKVGFNFAKFIGNDAAKHKSGLTGGVGIGVPMTSWLAVQPELWYVMKGTSYGTVTDPDIGGTTYYGTYELLFAVDYLELPVLVRTEINSGPVRPVLLFGPVVAWKVLEKFHMNGVGDEELAASNHAGRALDLAATAGFALELGPGPSSVVLEGRYTRSINNIQKPQFEGVFKNTDLRFTVGWRTNWPTFGIN